MNGYSTYDLHIWGHSQQQNRCVIVFLKQWGLKSFETAPFYHWNLDMCLFMFLARFCQFFYVEKLGIK